MGFSVTPARPTLKLFIFCTLFFLWMNAAAQVVVNGGLEGPVGSSMAPNSWDLCSGSPDQQIIQGTGAGIFGINTPPQQGTAYTGLVTTDYGYIESIGQAVNLVAGQTYTGSIRLYRSTLHSSWNGTGRLEIRGGNGFCMGSVVLWNSGTINNLNNWQLYNITFTPSANYNYMVLQNTINLGSGGMNYFCMDNLILNTSAVLPVELLSFTATALQDRVNLDWEVTGIKGNERFDVDWSSDGNEFSKVGAVDAKGNQGIYAFSHTEPRPGTNYYRIRTVDENGQETNSEVRQVEHRRDHLLAAYPNPAHDRLNYTVVLYKETEVAVQLIDPTGRVAMANVGTYPAGSHTMALALPAQLSTGLYSLQVKMGAELSHSQIFVQR